MLEYTRIEPPMEIRVAGDSVLLGTAQVIKLVVVRVTENILRTVKLPIVLVPGTSWAGQELFEIVISPCRATFFNVILHNLTRALKHTTCRG